MNEIITEKKYPIRNIWLFKQILPAFIILLIYFVYFIIRISASNEVVSALSILIPIIFILFIFALMSGIPIIINLLRRSNFHYSLDEHFMTLHQGIISKQNRNVPYGRIQGVFVNQELSDRIFGLASLTIEDFSQGGKSTMDAGGYTGGEKSRHETLGFVGNKIHIPGLKKADAETLKEIVLQKVKENPIEDSQSGL